MKIMKRTHLSVLLFMALIIMSCTKEEEPIIEPIEPIIVIPSPFESLLGTWQVETIINGGDTIVVTESDILHIEENLDTTDYFASGYFQRDENEKDSITLELFPDNQDSIVIKNGGVTFRCNYNLENEGSLEIDDSLNDDSGSFVWKTFYTRI